VSDPFPRRIGRYELYGELAAGGMATVHLGRLRGPVGFARTVAIKKLRRRHASDPNFTSMLIDEALLAARIKHPNVVPVLDVAHVDEELFVVMDYVPGENLAALLAASAKLGSPVPIDVAAGVMIGVLHGLHAAHEATDDDGAPLGLIHRDISPENLMITKDGVARLLAQGLSHLPHGAARGLLIGGSVGIVLALIEDFTPKSLKKYTLSSTAVGIAWVIPAFNSISMFLGAFFAWVFLRVSKEKAERFNLAIASGFIAGESLIAVVIAALVAFKVLQSG